MNLAFDTIKDHAQYNLRMEKSMMDKLFFVDKIEPEVVVDYGCATGCLLTHLKQWMPNVYLVGYDIDEQMIQTARERHINEPQLKFYQRWDDVDNFLKQINKNTAIVLSSIIHEIYHYCEPCEIDSFWQRLFNHNHVKYIVIRDMVPSRAIDRPSDITDVARVYGKYLHRQMLQDFQNVWGTIENNRQLTHFLLKYRYEEPNWSREVNENYFPIFREDLLAKIPENFRIVYHEHYSLPYIRRTVREDFGIELKEPTHLKLILERL